MWTIIKDKIHCSECEVYFYCKEKTESCFRIRRRMKSNFLNRVGTLSYYSLNDLKKRRF